MLSSDMACHHTHELTAAVGTSMGEVGLPRLHSDLRSCWKLMVDERGWVTFWGLWPMVGGPTPLNIWASLVGLSGLH